MVFVGDIALPHINGISIDEVPLNLKNKQWFGNLEGAIIDSDENKLMAIYNNDSAIEKLIDKFHFVGFALANNHIFDIGDYKDTIEFLKEKEVQFTGIGKNIYEANREVVIYEGNQQIVIVNFGWEVIQCKVTDGDFVGVNPLRKNHVLDTVSKLVEKYPLGKIIPYMHWGYELESEPQPFERELARKIIDLGAAGVVGCHSHRIGGFEVYKNKPIVYSLGNWLFKQNHYFAGKHKFPEFCNLEMAFEWDLSKDAFCFHFFKYNVKTERLVFLQSEGIDSELMRKQTTFRGYTNVEYIKWYKKNHFHKNKGLPIYYWEDSKFMVLFKNVINKIRDKIIFIVLKII